MEKARFAEFPSAIDRLAYVVDKDACLVAPDYSIEQGAIEFIAHRQREDELHIGAEPFGFSYTSWVGPKNSPYMHIIATYMRRFYEMGLVIKWKRDAARQTRGPAAAPLEALKVHHLQALFYVMALGLSVAILTFIAEILVVKYWK